MGVDDILERRQGIAPLAEHPIIDQPLLAAKIAAVEGHAEVVAGRRLAIGGLVLMSRCTLEPQARAIIVSCGCSGNQASGASLS